MTDIVDPRFLSDADRAAQQHAAQRAELTERHQSLLAWLFDPAEPHAGRPQCLITGPTRDQKGRQR